MVFKEVLEVALAVFYRLDAICGAQTTVSNWWTLVSDTDGWIVLFILSICLCLPQFFTVRPHCSQCRPL